MDGKSRGAGFERTFWLTAKRSCNRKENCNFFRAFTDLHIDVQFPSCI